MASSLVSFLITCFVVALVVGLIVFLIRRAPIVAGEYKGWLEWLAIAIGIIIVIINALRLLGAAV